MIKLITKLSQIKRKINTDVIKIPEKKKVIKKIE